MKNDSDVYAKYQNESRLLSEFYSKEHVLNMWREFYLSAYKDKQEELLNKKKIGVFMKKQKYALNLLLILALTGFAYGLL